MTSVKGKSRAAPLPSSQFSDPNQDDDFFTATEFLDHGLERDDEIDPNDPKIFRDGRAPRETDIFIAVMGVTGCGKSSLISLCCKRPVQIGHDLQACTAVVDVYPFELTPKQTVFLIDTPGFDDTNRSDSDVLREIASWLTTSFRNKVLLHGIIYLHRILDPRMQGSARKNLIMFKKLCGDDALKKVILATTMWDIVPEETAKARHAELVSTPEFWGYMVDKGSRTFKHQNTLDSARKIIESLIDDDGKTMVLELQNQMVNESILLPNTAAGQELQAGMALEREKWERELRETQASMEEAIRQRDEETEEALSELKIEYEQNLERLEREHRKLMNDTEQLHTERIERFENALKLQEIVRRKGYERRPADIMDAPTFSYSIADDKHCFAGPASHLSNCIGTRSMERLKTLIKYTDSHGAIWCGIGGSWIYKFKAPEGGWMTRYNKKVIDNYPLLRETIVNPHEWVSEWPHWICLGPDQHFIIQWRGRLPNSSRLARNLPTNLAALLNTVARYGQLHAAALGFGGSYVFVPIDGTAVWDLKGHYPGMLHCLEQQANDIEAVALNPTSRKDYIIHYRDGSIGSSVESCISNKHFKSWHFMNTREWDPNMRSEGWS